MQEDTVMKKGLTILLTLMLVCSVSSLALAQTTFKLAHVYNPDHAWDQGAHLAAKLVSEKTNGEIQIEIFPASQLGTEEQITEAVIFGSVDMCVAGAGQIGNLFKPINVAEMPYTFEDNNHVLRFAKSDIAKEMFADLEEEYQIKVIGTSAYGIRQLLAVDKPIRTPDDLEGFKLRVPEQQICVEYGKAMGANPTPIAYAEAYMALQQGVVDGLENPMSALKNMKFYEVAKYVNLTSHVTNVCFFLMNGRKFNGLSEEHQQIILESFEEASQLIVDILNKDDQELGSFFEEQGLTIIQPDIEAFKKATAEMPVKLR
ncbi:DctP family TRAP transporter solute-binding subunit, partial [candidate division KSB3 bacterium]|nr:DctP family TRAP transporter solute-binding subunit [candidate division KSB3 bacterium]MBD3326494.1 DctP family TRAP transporter solute-binding subunit [candidate division KSB3 bacterium]